MTDEDGLAHFHFTNTRSIFSALVLPLMLLICWRAALAAEPIAAEPTKRP